MPLTLNRSAQASSALKVAAYLTLLDQGLLISLPYAEDDLPLPQVEKYLGVITYHFLESSKCGASIRRSSVLLVLPFIAREFEGLFVRYLR